MPAAPPSILSKKFMELQIPTIQMNVMIASVIFEPVGFPTVSFAIMIPAVKIPDAFVFRTLRQIFANLIENAARHGGKEDLKVEVLP